MNIFIVFGSRKKNISFFEDFSPVDDFEDFHPVDDDDDDDHLLSQGGVGRVHLNLKGRLVLCEAALDKL